MRKINQLLRKNKREIERSMNQLQPLKRKTESLVKRAAKSGDLKTAKLYARELINITRQHQKLHMSKTRLESITMAVNEQWQMRKLTNSLQTSTVIMKEVNLAIKLGVITGNMQELGKQLMKAGIINEMVDNMVVLDVDEELEDESQEEVNKIIENLTEDKFAKIETEVPLVQIVEPEPPAPVSEVEDESLLLEMQQRLDALQGS